LRYNQQVEKAGGVFSPIVFASGVSYINRPTRILDAKTYLAFVIGTTAERIAVLACENDLFLKREKKESDVGKECAPQIGCPAAERAAKYRICSFVSHDILIKWFCGEPTSRQGNRVYLGDREIINTKYASWKEKGLCPSEGIEPQQAYYTYEPYALLMSKADPCLIQFVQRSVYEFFSHRSKANALFSANFPQVKMSSVVANLFLLNAIDEERYFQVPDLNDSGFDLQPNTKMKAAAVAAEKCYQQSGSHRQKNL
jgi:hypothetical protein